MIYMPSRFSHNVYVMGGMWEQLNSHFVRELCSLLLNLSFSNTLP